MTDTNWKVETFNSVGTIVVTEPSGVTHELLKDDIVHPRAARLFDRLIEALNEKRVADSVQREITAALALFPIDFASQTFCVSGFRNGNPLEADNDTEFFSKKRVIALLEKLHGHLTAATTTTTAPAVPHGYALISVDALRAWGKLDEVWAACVYPTTPAATSQDGKCAQCHKPYRKGVDTKGCPKCAPGVDVPESEFQKPISAQEPVTDEYITSHLEAAGVKFQRFNGGISGKKDCWSTSGSQDVRKLANGVRAIIAALREKGQV